MENKIMEVEAPCENQQEGLAAVVTEMHSVHNILQMSSAGQAVMGTNLLTALYHISWKTESTTGGRRGCRRTLE